MKKTLTIAGSDSCGGAGIQADLKTFGALGVYGMSVITAVTAQNTRAVTAVAELSPEIVRQQLAAVFDDIEVDAVKIGMLANAEIIRTVGEGLATYAAKNIVLDPVMVSKSGYHLLRPEAVAALRELLPQADLVTPNLPEAELLTGLTLTADTGEAEIWAAAEKIRAWGAKNVLIKGGHRAGDASDWLLTAAGERVTLPGRRIATVNTHGTGCTLSSAIAAYLARGYALTAAVSAAKVYIEYAIDHAINLGQGVGPVGHYAALYAQAGFSE
jgi:hydroxymethylpyrimidine/phosphomethylpyrimidine kinase